MDIRTFCLGMLTIKEASGYEIKKMLEDPLRQFFDASFGSIYPALGKLTEDGLVTCTATPQDKRPDKKIYRITPQGRLAFLDELMRMPGRDRFRSEFLATMLFADLLPARHLSDVIDKRIAEYRQALAEARACPTEGIPIGYRFVAGYGEAIYSAAITYLEEHRHLLESHALLGTPRAAE